jgi:hypothetical protein
MNRIATALAEVERSRRKGVSFGQWARMTFDHHEARSHSHELIWQMPDGKLRKLYVVATTPARWRRDLRSGDHRWNTIRVGPLLVLALRLAA